MTQGQQPNPTLLAENLKSIAESELRNIEPYDKAILTLSSGALALSLAFTKDLVPPELAHANVVLYIAWSFFVLSLIANIYGYIDTLRSFPHQRRFIEDVFKTCTKTLAEYEEYQKTHHTRVETFNTCQGYFFLFGMLALTAYVAINYETRIRTLHQAPAPVAIAVNPPVPTAAPAPTNSPPIKSPTP